ncbi:uncharacterized protein PAC_17104 [Phialocephala subalpina]|uniref:Uncharacterized protein n=1 Tax=Phialocephala subalpina TaxID=576137 RepID=A0A1L7XQC1_9HELO|nr:uncharacterized protein PAC_17104 [Phialocephala subalpina]
MADGISDTGPGTKTCQVEAGDDGHRQLLPTLGPRPSFQGHQPPIQQNARTATDPAVSHEPKQSSADPVSELRLQSLDVRDQNHESILGRIEAFAMLESPVGSSQRPQTPEDKAENRPREVTYASSAAESPNQASRPPRQDSAYYSTRGVEGNGSEVGFDVQARQLRARERMLIRRERARRTRHRFRVCREKVQRARNDVRDAIDKLTRKFNEIRALNLAIPDSIDPYYEKLRVAQDELGPAEDEYDTLARRLDEEEDDLEEEEDHFYRHNELFNISVPESKINASLSPPAEPSQIIDSEPTDLALDNPLVREYLDKVEEAERLKEDIEDLEHDYLKESGAATFRQRHNIPLTEETSKFLDDYPRLHAEALNDLRDAEDALFNMRDQCLELGLFTESEHAYEPRDALCDDIMDSVYDARERSPIRVAALHLRYDGKTANFGDKKDYVNKWLLQWVEESTVGALLLRSWIYFEFPDNADKEKLGDERWSELAVENWDKDQAGDSANKNNRESRLDTIAGITPGAAGKRHATSTGRSGLSSSLRTLDAIVDEEEVMDEPLVGTESASHTTQQAGSPVAPGRQRASSAGEEIPLISLALDSTPTAASQVQTPSANSLGLPVMASMPLKENVPHPHDSLSVSIQSINSLATSGRKPSLQSSCTDNDSLHIPQDPSCNPNEESQIVEQTTDNPPEAEPTLPTSDHPDISNLPDISNFIQESTAAFSPPILETSQPPLSNPQNDMIATPKARPTIGNIEHTDMTTLSLDAINTKPNSEPEKSALFEVMPSIDLHNDTTSATPEQCPLNYDNTTTEISTAMLSPGLERTGLWEIVSASKSEDNISPYAQTAFTTQTTETPTLEIPTTTTPFEDPNPRSIAQELKATSSLPSQYGQVAIPSREELLCKSRATTAVSEAFLLHRSWRGLHMHYGERQVTGRFTMSILILHRVNGLLNFADNIKNSTVRHLAENKCHRKLQETREKFGLRARGTFNKFANNLNTKKRYSKAEIQEAKPQTEYSLGLGRFALQYATRPGLNVSPTLGTRYNSTH